MKPSRDPLNRILVPYKHDEFPRNGPRCPVCGCATIWCGDTHVPPSRDLYYCHTCDRRYIETAVREWKRMRKLNPEPNPEINLTCLLKLDPTWQEL